MHAINHWWHAEDGRELVPHADTPGTKQHQLMYVGLSLYQAYRTCRTHGFETVVTLYMVCMVQQNSVLARFPRQAQHPVLRL